MSRLQPLCPFVPQVVANCLYVMQQVGMLEGRVTRQLIISLLNHIRSFRWALHSGAAHLQ